MKEKSKAREISVRRDMQIPTHPLDPWFAATRDSVRPKKEGNDREMLALDWILDRSVEHASGQIILRYNMWFNFVVLVQCYMKG